MQNNGPLPMLVAGSLVVAVLYTLLVKGGWLIGIPMVLAVVVVVGLTQSRRR